MATQYDPEEARIKRQLALAQALRDSGQADPNMVTRSAGGYVIPVSPWDTLNKVASNAFGGYTQAKAEKDAAKLDATKKADTDQWMGGLNSALAPDELQPAKTTQSLVQPTTGGTTPDDPTAFARQIAGAIKNQDTAAAAQTDVDASDKSRRMSQYMKGMQIGGAPAAIGAEGLQREVLPKETTPYTLSEGDKRYDANNRLVAKGDPKQYKPAADSDVTMNVMDPANPKGFKTIFRRNFDPNTQQEWIKPEKDPLALNLQQEGEKETLAQAIYNYEQAPLPMGTRNPLNAATMARVSEIAKEKGVPYHANEYGARSKALNAFSTGKQGQTVRSFNVMVDHLHTLEDEYEKLNNGDVMVLNKWKNWAKEQFGASAPTTVEALKANIQGELVKAITGGPGAESDRKEALAAAVSTARSPAQVHDALKGIRSLAGGQLAGLRREFKATTSLDDDRFNTYLSPASQAILASLPNDTGNPNAPAEWAQSHLRRLLRLQAANCRRPTQKVGS
jgi:hypothetical protein